MPPSTAHLSRSPSPHDGSNAGDSAPGSSLRSSKDKECPFCRQAFTSSSLGRHLDLYIKPKNPKPPDGIHDVHKIREIRGKITRRQPRGGVKRHDTHSDASDAGGDSPPTSHSTTSAFATVRAVTAPAPTPTPAPASAPLTTSAGAIPAVHSMTPVPAAPAAPIEPRPNPLASAGPLVTKRLFGNERDNDPSAPPAWTSPGGGFRLPPDPPKSIWGANWQSTGVITGLPSHSADMDRFTKTWAISESKLAPIRSRSIDRAQLEGDETGRAAQLALREVLDSLEAARSRDYQANMWDFDFYGTTFPGLCLRLLESPRLLFSVHPSPSEESWPLDPPGHIQFYALRDAIATRGAKMGLAPSSVEVDRALRHLDNMYTTFSALSDPEKSSTWRLETLRAYSKTQKRLHEKTAELKLVRQQAEFFRQQFERAVAASRRSNAATPTSATLPAETRPDIYSQGLAGEKPLAPTQEMSDVVDLDPEARSWNYERLIAKWRGKIREAGPQVVPTPTLQQLNGTASQTSHASSAGSPTATMQSASPTVGSMSRDRDTQREVRFLWDDGGHPRGGSGSSAPPSTEADTKRASGGSTQQQGGEWMDAASVAVERVWNQTREVDRMGKIAPGQGAYHHHPVTHRSEDSGDSSGPGSFNPNGKRARPPSWSESGRIDPHGEVVREVV